MTTTTNEEINRMTVSIAPARFVTVELAAPSLALVQGVLKSGGAEAGKGSREIPSALIVV